MPPQTTMFSMCIFELVLWMVLICVFRHKKRQIEFPSMNVYLILNLTLMPLQLISFYGSARQWFNNNAFAVYFWTYWLIYFANSVLLIYIMRDVVRRVFSGMPELSRYGLSTLKWVVAVSMILAIPSSILYYHIHNWILESLYDGMRLISIIGLCSTTFMLICMRRLNLSFKHPAFGLTVGFIVRVLSDFINTQCINRSTTWNSASQYCVETVIILAIGTWITFSCFDFHEAKSLRKIHVYRALYALKMVQHGRSNSLVSS